MDITQYSTEELVAAAALVYLSRQKSKQAYKHTKISVENGDRIVAHAYPVGNMRTPLGKALSENSSDSDSSTITVKLQTVSNVASNVSDGSPTTSSCASLSASYDDSEFVKCKAGITDSHSASSEDVPLSRAHRDHVSKHDPNDDSDGSTITVKVASQSLGGPLQALGPNQDLESPISSVVDTPSDNDFYYNDTTDEEMQQILLEEDMRAEDMSDYAPSESTSEDSDCLEPSAKKSNASHYVVHNTQAAEEFTEDTPSPSSLYDADSEMTDDTEEM